MDEELADAIIHRFITLKLPPKEKIIKLVNCKKCGNEMLPRPNNARCKKCCAEYMKEYRRKRYGEPFAYNWFK